MQTSAEFQAPIIEGKAVEETEDGPNGAEGLWIEGVAANLDIDRQDEAFLPGALESGIKAYMETNPLLAYHHGAFGESKIVSGGVKNPELIPMGLVTELDMQKGGTLHMKAFVQKPTAGSWAEDIYEKVRTGVIKMLSVGGKFMRTWTPEGPRIYKTDIQEISLTPLGVNAGTTFEVIAGKAFTDNENPADVAVRLRIDALDRELDELEGKAAVSGTAVEPNVFDKQFLATQIRSLERQIEELSMLHENGQNPEIGKFADGILEYAAATVSKLHTLAAKHGPLPSIPSEF